MKRIIHSLSLDCDTDRGIRVVAKSEDRPIASAMRRLLKEALKARGVK